ncbi:MAG: hypothetical protein ABIW76_06555 [Fibrobacteria bacterium]
MPIDSFSKSSAESLLKRPGDSLFGTSGSPSFSPDVFTKPRSGRGRGTARRKANQDAQAANEAAFDKDHRERITVKDPEPPPKPKAKLSNGKWLMPQGKYGQDIEACVDVELPPEIKDLTRVVFVVFELTADGKRVERWRPKPGQEPHAKDGKAICKVTVPTPAEKDGQLPVKAYYQFVAKHVYSEEHQGPSLEAAPGPPLSGFESFIFYAPLDDEYLIIDNPEDFKSLDLEIKQLEGLKGATRRAWEAPDDSRRKEVLDQVNEEAPKLFGMEALNNPKVALKEVINLRKYDAWGKTGNWEYIRPSPGPGQEGAPVKGKWVKADDPALKKNLDDLLKKAPGHKEASPLLSGSLSLKLFEVKPKSGQPLKWNWKKQVDKEGKIVGQHFTFSKEGAVCRYAYGWDGLEASANLREKNLKIGTSGFMNLALFEGSMTGKIPCPETGVNLLQFLDVKGVDLFLKKGRKCLLRLQVILSAKAFAGLSVKAALAIPNIDLSKEKPGEKKPKKVEGGGDVGGTLGVQVSDSLAVAPEWSPTDERNFKALGKAQVEIGATVGLSGEAKFKVEYANGVFKFKAGAGISLGFGPRAGFQFEVGIGEGWRLVGHLLSCVDYRKVSEISREAFIAYQNYTFTLMILGSKALLDGVITAGEAIGDFKVWLRTKVREMGDTKTRLWDSTGHSSALKGVPPEALGQALQTLMVTREPEDFRSIKCILGSTLAWNAEPWNPKDPSANHKLKWTLRCVTEAEIPEAEGPAKDTKKDEALKAGIKRIRDFGWGTQDGKKYVDKDGNEQETDEKFLDWFEDFLYKNKVG